MRDEFQSLLNIFDEAIEQKNEVIRNLTEQYKNDLNSMRERWERAEEEKIQILRNKQTTGDDSKVKVSDLRSIGQQMIETTKGLAEAEESAKKKQKFLRDLLEDGETEDLAEVSLEELQRLDQEDSYEQASEKLQEQAGELRNTYNKLLEETRLDETPSATELEQRKHSQASIQERIRGIDDEGELVNIFKEIATQESDPMGREAYQLISNRIRNVGNEGTQMQLDRIREEHILSEGERKQLDKHRRLKNAGDFVEMLPDTATAKAEQIHNDNMSADEAEEFLEDSVKPIVAKISETVKAEETSGEWDE